MGIRSIANCCEVEAQSPVTSFVSDISGKDIGSFGGLRWFFRDSELNVIIPNLYFELLPELIVGSQSSWEQWNDTSTPCLWASVDFRFRQEKITTLRKRNVIHLDYLFVEAGKTGLTCLPFSDVCQTKFPNDQVTQTSLPTRLLCTKTLHRCGRTSVVYLMGFPPGRTGWGLGPASPPERDPFDAIIPPQRSGPDPARRMSIVIDEFQNEKVKKKRRGEGEKIRREEREEKRGRIEGQKL